MYSGSLVVLALAVFGASAQSICGLNGINTVGVNTLNTCGTSVASTPVFENLPIRIPGFVGQTTVQDSCNCVKTVVRPQMRKEIVTVPSVQRFVQTTTTPVVETIPYVKSSAVEVPAAINDVSFGVPSAGFSGVVPSVGFSGVVPSVGFSGVVPSVGFSGVIPSVSTVVPSVGGLVSGINTGIVGSGLVGGCVC